MSKFNLKVLILLTGLIVEFKVFSQSNMVVNGDFTGGTSSWADCSNLVEAKYSSQQHGGVVPYIPNFFSEVDSGNGPGNPIGDADDKKLCQSISGFVIGSCYQLCFDVQRRPGPSTCTTLLGQPATVTTQITIDNGAFNVMEAHNGTSWGWSNVCYIFTATSTTHLLTFSPTDVTPCGNLFTNISVIKFNAIATDVQSACGSYAWIDGNTYTSSNNTATHTLVGGSANGCDSIVTLDLTINDVTTGTDVQSACGSYAWIDGNTYTSSNNTATHTLVGGLANGCDSIVTLDLTINNVTTGTDVQSACGSYAWIDGNTYTSSNNTATHLITAGSSNGCDSIVTLNLTISSNIIINLGPDLYVCDETVTLSPGTGFSSYTWNNNNTTEKLLITNDYGTYHVTVTDIDGCVGYDEVEIIKECPANLWVPNVFTPNGDDKNEIFNAVGDNLTSFTLKVFNRWGNLLFETNSIDNGWDGTYQGSQVSSGTYVYLIDYSYKKNQNTVNETIKGTIALLK